MKKIISFVLTTAILLAISANAVAADASEVNIDLLVDHPPYVETRGGTPPTIFDVWNIAEKGRYNFSGYAEDYSTTALYTKYHFTGETQYLVKVNNNSDNSVEITFRGWYTNYREEVIPANSSLSYIISSEFCEADINEDTIWYIRFSRPCDVSGYVEAL